MQEPNCREPADPQNYFVEILHVDNAEHKNEFVENEIPKFVFHVLQGNE